MLQPVLVRPVEERYQLIAGERRHRAAIEAQLHEVPARVLELDDQHVCELAMVENLQREDLNAIEKAIAFRQYLETYGGTQEELANRLGLDRSTVSNLLRLLDLPPEVRDAVMSKSITQGHARALLGLSDPAMQVGACQRVIAENLSVRQTEALVATGEPTPPKSRKLRVDGAHEIGASSNKAPHIVEWEGRLQERFGTAVLIKLRNPQAQRGQIVIDFHSQEEFDRITNLIRSGD